MLTVAFTTAAALRILYEARFEKERERESVCPSVGLFRRNCTPPTVRSAILHDSDVNSRAHQ